MRHMLKKAVALGLAVTLATMPLASASEALGWDLYEGTTQLATDTYLTTEIFWSDTYADLRTEHYITYTPNSDVTPVVTYGDYVLQRETLTTAGSGLESDGERVVGGINGDFYTLVTGSSIGMVITDGIIRASSAYYNSYALGFFEDGTAIVGQPEVAITASFSGYSLAVNGGLNRIRTETGGYYLYNDTYGDTTLNTSPGVDVILSIVTDDVGEEIYIDRDMVEVDEDTDVLSDDTLGDIQVDYIQGEMVDVDDLESGITLTQSTEFTIGSHITCTVDAVLESTTAIEIPEGKLVLSINNEGDAWLIAQLLALEVGDTVELDVTATDSQWEDVVQAVGALYVLVEDGQLVDQPSGTDSLWSSMTARTAVGIKEDGTLIFYTIDGLQSGYSVGATLTQVAERLIELGCVDVVCMDGGGSTTLGATYAEDDSFSLISSPSGGTQRANTNAIFLVSSLPATGELASFSLTPANSLVMAGSDITLTAAGVDSAYYPVDYDVDLTYEIISGSGSVTTSGTFTAGDTTETVVLSVSGGEATGTTEVNVVANPTLTVTNEATGATVTSLSLTPGDTINLDAVASYRTIELLSSDSAFGWSADESVGTIDPYGNFTASTTGGSGNITLQGGGTTVTIPVTVANTSQTIETFENGISAFTDTGTATASVETTLDYVRYGKQSMAVTYDTSDIGIATLVTSLDLTGGEPYLTLWVYGDGSGNLLSMTVSDDAGTATTLSLTALDDTGWCQILVELPSGTTSVDALQVVYGGNATGGTIRVDQILTSSQAVMDTSAPDITISYVDGTFMAQVVDDVDATLPKENISLTWDGDEMAFTWDESYGFLTATLPAGDSTIHRVTVTATDASGNISRASYDFPVTTDSDSIFADTDGHWSEPYAEYLYDKGITTGTSSGDILSYSPKTSITRAQFFTMVARWLDVDLTLYEDVELPFADVEDIPSWALSGIQAMYDMGILQGSSSGGVLLCNPNDTITRAEAFTILGRTQDKGYEEVALTFDDSDQISSWASYYVSSLVGQGVISGYNNLIQPKDELTRGEVAKILYAMN